MSKLVEEVKAEPVSAETKEKPKKECEDCKLYKAQIESLQKSFQLKCQDYDQLLNAYRSLAIRFNAAGEAARTFAKSLNMSIELVFPTDKKGE